jgi:tetratricopeptide (TPR) repeat protein
LLASALVLAGIAWVFRAATGPPQIIPSEVATAISPGFLDPAEVDRLIGAYEGRIRAHTDALDYQTLGFLYLEKGRLTGDVSRYLAAEEAFRRARDLFPSDPTIRIGLASALFSLHDFAAARDEATVVYEQVQRPDALAVMADSNLALGDYERASAQLAELADMAGDQPAVLVRRAEWARLEGRAEDLRSLILQAVDATAEVNNRRQRAWYRAFAAQASWYLGDYQAGLEFAQEALTDDPESREGTIASARLLAATGEVAEALTEYERATSETPDPTLLAEMLALYQLEGKNDRAEDTAALLETVTTLTEAQLVYDRAISLYLADHSIDPTRAVEIAQADLDRRHDVGAWDALAWALYAGGQFEEAAAASVEALRLGTIDARYLYHAGMIAAAAGESDRARELLERALTLSPGFFPADALRAREALSDLG